MTDLLKKIGSRSGLTGIFIISFLFFSVVAFPYEVLKESVSNGLSRALGITIVMEDLGAAFPIGIKASGLSVSTSGQRSRTVELHRLTIRLNPLYLFLLKVGVRVTLEGKDGSSLSSFISIPIISLLGQGGLVPGVVELDASKFRVDDFFSIAFAKLAEGRGINPLLAPVLEGLGITGKLDGSMRVALNAKAPQESTGEVNLRLLDGLLILSDPSLGLPDQKLNKAQIKAILATGVMNLDAASGIESDELTLTISGAVAVKSPPTASQLQLELFVQLKKSLEEKFGFLLGAFSGGVAKNGEIRIQVRGPLMNPQTQTL